MANESQRLAHYAAQLRYDDIPPIVVRRAKDCLIDAVAAGYRGNIASWSGIVKRQMEAAPSGDCRVLGMNVKPVRAESAAMANGILIHALEMDSLRKPGVGVHPGAILVPAALAAAQERRVGGKELLTAFVAGCEVLVRVGRASKHSIESKGLHAPGLTGPFGSATAAGHIFGLDGATLAGAFGLAGSMGGGLLEFSRSGGMLVKRLHMGRAAEAGIAAARWAEAGMSGPAAVLEGKYGFLKVYCEDSDADALVAGLGETFETTTICLKRYPCHITAHTPVRAAELLRAEYGFQPEDIERVTVEGSRRMIEHNATRQPADPIMAQLSIPFCVAVGLCADTSDPDNFGERSLHDPVMRDLRDRIDMTLRADSGGHSDWTTAVSVALKDGRVFRRLQDDFPGTPSSPLDSAELERKFMALTGPVYGHAQAQRLLARLQAIETESKLDWLGLAKE